MHPKPYTPVEPGRLLGIAKNWGTPTYVYSEKVIKDRCLSLQNLFSDLPVSWLYAVKANDNPHILKLIGETGMGFDTVSYEEVLLCLKLGTNPQKIFYTENNMSDAEMHGSADKGVVLNIGSIDRLQKFCESYSGSNCCIRIKPDISDGHHKKVDTGNLDSKFGIRIDKLPEAVAIAEKHNVSITGIHAHIGSGIKNPENLITEIEVLLNIAHNFNRLEFINFGGGIPIPYRKGESQFDLSLFNKLVSERLKSFLSENNQNYRFLFEPGRWVTGPAGLLLTQITAVKDQGRRVFLGTDTGFNHLLRPALYDAYHEVMNISAVSNMTEKPPDEMRYDIAGNICESGDVLAENRLLPLSNAGDYLAICDTGAYGMTMASHYNRRAMPAEILITGDGHEKSIRTRKSPERTVNDFLVDTNFENHDD